ncbi:serine protease [Burkholderia sp. BCC1977]|uniref:S1 family peptidase n=1 Tax=Burkholderia sp. BCC1977 TaxID=2817440 RepID=UPI002ABE8DAA|nr:serine protease [Burkholderia sp. BCC1977]
MGVAVCVLPVGVRRVVQMAALALATGFALPQDAGAEPAVLLAAYASVSSSSSASASAPTPTPAAAATAYPDATTLDVNATGIFINDAGDVLTARHAVAECRSLFVIKDTRVARARVKTLGTDRDLAVVSSALRPLLPAAFAHTPPGSGAQPVFAAGYDALRRMPDRAAAVFNGLTRPGAARAGDLTLLLPATHGASGAAVLDRAGRVIGVVTDRADVSAGDPRAVAARADAARYVIAVPVDAVKTFLRVNGIPYEETDAPQLEPLQPHAARAATLQVGILCGG